jgi:hypothetical protein
MSLVRSIPISGRSIRALTGAAVSCGLGFGLVQWFRNRKSHHIDVEVLTYPDVITYFVENRPQDDQIRSGALLRERQRNLWILSFIFLNSEGSICSHPDGTNYGQRLRVRNLDQEMMDLFSDKDLVVFE